MYRFGRNLFHLRLHCSKHVREFRAAFLSLYTVGCSPEEISQIESIDSAGLDKLGSSMVRCLGAHRRIPRIRALCFGASATLSILPQSLRAYVSKCYGVWLVDFKTIVVRFGSRSQIRTILVHELAHALMDILSNEFPFPLAIKEGVACAFEHWFAREPDPSRTMTPRLCNQCLGPEEYMTVRDLLFFDPVNEFSGDVAHARMTRASFWLYGFVLNLAEHRPRLRVMLSELPRRGVTTPDGTYRWMQEALGWTSEQLESAFREYCTEGALPRASAD